MNKKLLKYISGLRAQELKKLVNADAYERGMNYHRNGFVETFSWSDDKTTLRSLVSGNDDYMVRLELSNEALKSTCTCPAWDVYGPNCKHVAASLFTIIHIHDAKRYASNMLSDIRMQRLRNQLAADQPIGSSKKIPETLRVRAGWEKIHFESENAQGAFQPLPEGIRPFWQKDREISIAVSERITALMQNPKASLRLQVQTPLGEAQPTIDKSQTIRLHLHFEASADTVTARIQPSMGGKKINHSAFPLGWSLALNLDKNTIVRSSGNEAFNLFSALVDFYETDPNHYGENSIYAEIDLADFCATHFTIHPEDADHVSFFVTGKPAQPKSVNSYPRVYLEPSPDIPEEFTLSLRDEDGGLLPSDFEALLNLLVQDRETRTSFTPLFTTITKRTVVASLLLELFPAENPPTPKSIKRWLEKNPPFPEQELNELITQLFVQLAHHTSEPHQALLYDPSHKQWSLLHVSEIHPLRVIAHLTLLTKSTPISTDEHTELSLDRNELMPNLQRLTQLLNQDGLDVYFNSKPLRQTKLDFDFTVRKGSNIDWFELKPEVTCDGKALSKAEWEAILQGEQVVSNDEETRILALESLSIIERVKRLLMANTSHEDKDVSTGIVPLPRLAIFELAALHNEGVQLQLPSDQKKILDSLYTAENIDQKKQPSGIEAQLREYQLAGFSWLAFLYEHRLGGCLADDMGLGKTIQTITLLQAIKQGSIPSQVPKSNHRPHLIVVPPSLLFNWTHEIKRFAPDLVLHEYSGTKRAVDDQADVILTTYELVRRDIKELKSTPFHIIIFDEAQAIKNIKAKRASACRQLQGTFRLCLTGTPLENHIGEYFSIIDLCVPGLLGGYDDFMQEAQKDSGAFLTRRTQPFILRRTKQETLKELPPKTEQEIHLQLTPDQKEFYTRTTQQIRETTNKAFKEKSRAQAGIIALTALLRLRQICVTPALLDKEQEWVSPKFNYLSGKCQELIDEGHAALVFSQFTQALDQLELHLKKENISYLRMDGKTPAAKRKKIIGDFQDENGPSIFLISLKTGGVGLNLTRASYVFHLDPWWNPAVENQATDRTHRIGQKNPVFVYRLIMEHTIEEKMLVLKEKKQELFDQIVQSRGSQKTSGLITREDLDFLLDTL